VVLKPDIVLYGEMLPVDTWTEAEEHCRRADVILVAGSSLSVWPAAALPEVALEQGAHLILNNRTATPLNSRATVHLTADVAEVIPEIARILL
jgi:NAD-dependent deacetylase